MADTGTAGELLGWLYAAFKILSLLAIIYLAVVEARRYRRKALEKKREEGDLADESAPKAGDRAASSGQRRRPDRETSQDGREAKPKE